MFTIRINTDNEAFKSQFSFDADGEPELDEEATEVREIIRKVSRQLKAGYTEGVCIDSNGNKVGRWEYKD